MRTSRHIILLIAAVVAAIALASCSNDDQYSSDPEANFEALWTVIDEHYCFFEARGIDWNEVGSRYRKLVSPQMTPKELFDVCAQMVRELHDGHTTLSSPFDVAQYRYWDEYPHNFDLRTVQEKYLNFNYRQATGMIYGILPSNYGYIYYGDFMNAIGDGNLDWVLAELATTDGLIIDVRDNGGGLLTNVETLVRRFITERLYCGAITHKTGPGHNDMAEPFDYYFEPAAEGRMRYEKPVVILTNRSSYSATNNFVSIMKQLPQVRIVGDRTGGGCGLPFTNELPNGWRIRFSSCIITDADGQLTEFGIDPSEGCKVDITDDDVAAGRDTILERAVEVLTEMLTQ